MKGANNAICLDFTQILQLRNNFMIKKMNSLLEKCKADFKIYTLKI